MIRHWKALDLEITDSEYHHDPTSSCEIIPSQTSNPQTCEEHKSFRITNIRFIIGKRLTWRSQILIITMMRHPHVKFYHLKTQTL